MRKQSPFILQRPAGYTFRIAVPIDLRAQIGQRELTRALKAGSRAEAGALALEMAAKAKRLFSELRQVGMTVDRVKQSKLISEKLTAMRQREHEQELEETVQQLEARFKRDLEVARMETELRVLRQFGPASALVSTTALMNTRTGPADAATKPAKASPRLSVVIKRFLDAWPAGKKQSMLAKQKPALRILNEMFGAKAVADLRQADIRDYFALLHRLPPLWSDKLKKLGCTIQDLSQMTHPKTLSGKTIEDGYRICIGAFLKDAYHEYGDEGFPASLSVDRVVYTGDEDGEGEGQRAFQSGELRRLFEGPEMQALAADLTNAYRYWLPHVALFSGARANELCQINPQTDVLKDSISAIWYLWITDKTPGDPRIIKTIKNEGSRRKIPVHSKLIELGFLDYVAMTKAAGSMLLFPQWEPSKRKRASGAAERWFSKLLKKAGLRDETSGARVVGMHAFRHTFITAGNQANVRVEALTGHVNADKSVVVRGYEADPAVARNQAVLEQIHFDVEFIMPVNTSVASASS